MPPWMELVVSLTQEDSDMLLESFKAFKISKSDEVPCTVCANSASHNMRKQLLRCACCQCKEAVPHALCAWRGKQLKFGRQVFQGRRP
ncbi:hypothetical protein PHMEG_00018487 [Phytophthora megakarya]|uniref:Uncharacterized protein n=1 Tax=Phytophthora megakarya TaxID=4795 RepID=A0A225VU93_9STRA|nr:hypothetical protein PHMEG_00018487 [Phytophthora megakarya]